MRNAKNKNKNQNKNAPGSGLLKEQAYQRLKELVLSGQLSEMSFVSERMLARQLGMSNTPVRSAVERLEVEGMLTIGPQQGIAVRELTHREIADHFEIRQALETLVVRKLAGRLRPEQIDELRANVASHQASLDSGDVQQYIARDGEFHVLLAEFSGNADVEAVLRQLRARLYRVVLRVIDHMPARMRESIDEHREIIESLVAGDAARAAAVMTQHLRGGLKALLPAYRQEEVFFLVPEDVPNR